MQTRRFLIGGFAAIVTLAGSACSSGSPQEPVTPTSSVATSTRSSAPTSTPSRSQGSPTPSPTPGLPTPTTSAPMIPNPNGDGSLVPCEGTVCTNPNHGGGDDPDGDAPPEPGQTEMQGPGAGSGPPEPGQGELQPNDGPSQSGQTATPG